MTPPVPIPSADEVIARLRVALAELGYGDAFLASEETWGGWPDAVSDADEVPNHIWWTACSLVYPTQPCWACYLMHESDACIDGNCAHPDGPAKPPRELLVARAS